MLQLQPLSCFTKPLASVTPPKPCSGGFIPPSLYAGQQTKTAT
jgi:hypothetical protein